MMEPHRKKMAMEKRIDEKKIDGVSTALASASAMKRQYRNRGLGTRSSTVAGVAVGLPSSSTKARQRRHCPFPHLLMMIPARTRFKNGLR